MIRIERVKSLSEEVTIRLRWEIVEGAFALGESLSESMIAARYGVSRTPVREAFAFLGQEGLVRTEPQHGTYVFSITREEFARLSETRSILETAALRLSHERNRKALIRGWRRIAKAMQTTVSSERGLDYCRLDGEFHELLFNLADNPHLVEASQSFATKIATVRNRLGATGEHMRRSLGEHQELLKLLEADEIDRAVELLDRHIRFKGEAFWAGIDEAMQEARDGQKSDQRMGTLKP